MRTKDLLKKVTKIYTLFSFAYVGVKFIQCRGLGKEDDRHLIGRAIDALTGDDVDYDDIIIIDDTELHVSYNPYMQLFTNSIGAIAIVMGTNVYTDVHFRNMSKSTQKAILAHEMGHYKCNHTPSITYTYDRLIHILTDRLIHILTYTYNRLIHILKGKVLPMELEADAYAVNVVGKENMIKALLELKQYLKGVSAKEIDLRIKAIKETM